MDNTVDIDKINEEDNCVPEYIIESARKICMALLPEKSKILPKKAKIFEDAELAKFLTEADNFQYLAARIIVIFGIFGATRTIELTKLEVDQVEEHGNVFVVELEATKTDVDWSFVIEGCYREMVRKYRQLHVPATPHQRFFVNYQKGACTVQPIGKHKFAGTPKLVLIFQS
ncbi:hypothetical protein Bhyg_07777 [Pseudolycoriella hygida]|uniref:Uncharacterized protein n=1 Tax=Pseudolycoriella hygida TaxID=35572 RepID=A0A9Q0S3P3_9DIPT|nr:hypothetical protein Bhyg_07777 [Pseudolycoriella hygida]